MSAVNSACDSSANRVKPKGADAHCTFAAQRSSTPEYQASRAVKPTLVGPARARPAALRRPNQMNLCLLWVVFTRTVSVPDRQVCVRLPS